MLANCAICCCIESVGVGGTDANEITGGDGVERALPAPVEAAAWIEADVGVGVRDEAT